MPNHKADEKVKPGRPGDTKLKGLGGASQLPNLNLMGLAFLLHITDLRKPRPRTAKADKKERKVLFKKDAQLNREEVQMTNAQLIAVLRRKMHMQLVIIALCLGVLCISSYAYITRAWFANNREVQQNNTTITSDTPTASLYIRPGTAADNNDKLFWTSVTKNASADCKLFPISTMDLTNWYYVSQFAFVSSEETVGNVTYSVSKQVASEYTKVTGAAENPADSGVYTYTNAYEGNATKVAFFMTESNLYTVGSDGDSLDIYFEKDNPIEVKIVSDAAVSTNGFYESIRVGVKTANKTVIFAPVAETASGNSTGAAALDTSGYKFKAITAAGSVTPSDASSVVGITTASVNNYYAVVDDTKGSGFFKADAGAQSIGNADTANGLDVQIYVWLEGTDGQALVGVADGNTVKDALNVTVNFVGVDPAN